MSKDKSPSTKLFVLDTNVIMHDPTCFYRFEEHDVHIPMCVLEELDDHKKGTSDVARNVRQAMRFLDDLVRGSKLPISEGIQFQAPKRDRTKRGKLFFQTENHLERLPEALAKGKADNEILAVLLSLQNKNPKRQTILVSKDINMRIKGASLGIVSEDYTNDKVLEDTDLMYTGIRRLTPDACEHLVSDATCSLRDQREHYRVDWTFAESLVVNELIVETDPKGDRLRFIVDEVEKHSVILRTLVDYTRPKNTVWGINAKNVEQNIALNLLMDPDVDIVTLLGQAGTGKTLLTLAAGLEQVLESQQYSEIIMTRVTVPIGEDIGFLPGTEEEKMYPWMGALQDNLEFLLHHNNEDGKKESPSAGNAWQKNVTHDLLQSRIKVKSLNFMRGRTFIRKFLIIDEAQNLTAKQMRTLITRAGPGTKVVCLGNVAQIDTPYLTEGSSGITHVVSRFKGWKHYGHVTLAQGERSRLAEHANEVM